MTSTSMNNALEAVRILSEKQQLEEKLYRARKDVEKDVLDLARAAGMKAQEINGIIKLWWEL